MSYEFSPTTRKEILEAIHQHLPTIRCPLCQHEKWTMPDGFTTLPLLSNVWTGNRISGLPCAALICDNCGNTLLINLGMIGLGRLFGPDVQALKRQGQR